MLKRNRLLSIAIAAAILASAATAQAQVRRDSAGIWSANPFQCQTDEGYGRRGSCDYGGL